MQMRAYAVRLLALRGEEPPGDAVVVVRGGLNSLSAETVARSAGRNLAGVRVPGIGGLLALDLPVAQLGVELPELESETLGRLDDVFDLAVPNPGRD